MKEINLINLIITTEGEDVGVKTTATSSEVREAIYYANKIIDKTNEYNNFWEDFTEYLVKHKGAKVEIIKPSLLLDGDNFCMPPHLQDGKAILDLIELRGNNGFNKAY